MNEVPEDRCGQSISQGRISESWGGVCCWRPTWNEYERCIFHAGISGDITELSEKLRAESGQRLDGAYLPNVDLSDISLQHHSFSYADLSNSNFRNSDLSKSNLYGATSINVDFSHAKLSQAEMDDADFSHSTFVHADLNSSTLTRSNFSGATFWACDLSNAVAFGSNFSDTRFQDANMENIDMAKSEIANSNLSVAILTGADLWNSNLSNSELKSARLSKANLSEADLTGANIKKADLTATNLTSSNCKRINAKLSSLSNAELSETDFSKSNLTDSDLTDTDAQNATFNDANLEDATFIRTELRDANLRNARLYQTLFSDTRINSNTDFGEQSAYEDPDTELGEQYDDTSRFEAAAWVYRRLQDLHEQNAMSERARDYHVAKEEAHRAEYRENGEWFQWGVYTLNRYLTNHGESLKHVVAWSIGIIVACGLLYPFTGGMETANGIERATSASNLSFGLFAQSFYYSMVTFTTLGYGNPTGTGAKLLVGLESLAGTLLIALFVFVLGRRVAR